MADDKPLALSVYALIRDDADRILFLRRSSRSSNDPGKWDLPGGKIDSGETFYEALKREVFEETGLDIEPVNAVGVANSETKSRRIVNLVMNVSHYKGELRISEEHDKLAWFPANDIPLDDVAPKWKEFLTGLRL